MSKLPPKRPRLVHDKEEDSSPPPPPPPSITTALRGDTLCRLLSYCTPSQKLHKTQFISPEFHQATRQSTAWSRTFHLIVYRYNDSTPTAEQLTIDPDILYPDNEDYDYDVLCANMIQVLNRLHQLRHITLVEEDNPFELTQYLYSTIPKLRHLKLLELTLYSFNSDLTAYCHSLVKLIGQSPKLCKSVRLGLMLTTRRHSLSTIRLHLRTLVLAAQTGCAIERLILDNVLQIDHGHLAHGELKTITDSFRDVRLKKLHVDPRMLGHRVDAARTSFVEALLKNIQPGSLQEIFWDNGSNDEPERITYRSLYAFLDRIPATQFTELIEFKCDGYTWMDFGSDIGLYNSTERLLVNVTELLQKMPKLRVLTIQPSRVLAVPYTFVMEQFLLLVQCLMQRAMQHKDGCEVSLRNVLDFGTIGPVLEDLQAIFPLREYSLSFSYTKDAVVPNQKCFVLEVMHLATERVLEVHSVTRTAEPAPVHLDSDQAQSSDDDEDDGHDSDNEN